MVIVFFQNFVIVMIIFSQKFAPKFTVLLTMVYMVEKNVCNYPLWYKKVTYTFLSSFNYLLFLFLYVLNIFVFLMGLKYISRLDILNYLERCCYNMQRDELIEEINKIKNYIEENNVVQLRKLLGS